MAVTTARMKGWQTKAFLEKFFVHHRELGSAKHSVLYGAYHGGWVDYLLGCDPTWQLLRCLYRMATLRPYVLNGGLCLVGYLWAGVTRQQKVAPPELVRFRRREERGRLLEFGKRLFSWGSLRTSSQCS